MSYNTLSDAKQRIIDDTIQLEGRYGNNPFDSGGETCWGITKQTARRHGYLGPMQGLPLETAKDIYADEFWIGNKMDTVFDMSPIISEEMFDTGVNGGTARPWNIAQRILNAMNKGEWDVLTVNGASNQQTITALQKAIDSRGENYMFNILNQGQFAFYLELTERRPKDRAFFNGWISNRVKQV